MPHGHQAPAQGPTTDQEEGPLDGKFRPTYQNTYRLEPKRPWAEEAVLAVLKEVMHVFLDTVEYDPAKCAELASSVANEIRNRIRELNFDRYKIACIVNIYEKLFQGIHGEVGYLWDMQHDYHTTYNLSNTHIMATATVFGVYYE